MWSLINKINEQKRYRLIENRLTVAGGELGDWVKKVRGLRKKPKNQNQNKTETFIDTDNSMVISRRKGGGGRG